MKHTATKVKDEDGVVESTYLYRGYMVQFEVEREPGYQWAVGEQDPDPKFASLMDEVHDAFPTMKIAKRYIDQWMSNEES